MKNKLIDKANRRISFGGAATLLVVTALFSQTLGFLRNRLVSTNFTVLDPGSSDAFFAAFQIPDFFFYTIAAGALGVAFIPVLSDRLQSGDRKSAWRLTSSLLNVMAIAMAGVSLLIFLLAEPLMNLLVPNLPQENISQAVTIMRIIAFNPLLFTLSGIITSLQQTMGRFFFYAIAPIVYNVCIIFSIFLFRDTIGIVGLGIGALVGALMQLLIAMVGMRGIGFRWHPKITWKSDGFDEVVHQLPPRAVDQGIDQLNSIVETNRAQALGVGPISYYNYALTLQNVPIMLIGNSIATAAFPRLAERLSQGRPDLFRRDFSRILRMMIWVSIPFLVVSFFGRAYLARLIFGDVSPEVALIFGYLTASIFFRIVYSMLSRWFYAQKDTRTPLYVSVFSIALNIYLAFTLARSETYGISGLAMAQSFVSAAEVLVLTAIILLRDKRVFDSYFQNGLLKIVSVTGFTVMAGFISVTLLPLNVTDRGFFTLVTKLSIIAGATLTMHFLVSLIFSLEEAKIMAQKTRNVILGTIKV